MKSKTLFFSFILCILSSSFYVASGQSKLANGTATRKTANKNPGSQYPVSKLHTKRIDSIFQQFNRRDCPGCAVAVINAGKIIFQKGYGMANLEHNIPITPSTVFDVASVSKQFTAFAIALLSKKGKLSLNDNVRKYVPELPDFGRVITIRHLVHHTSGLRDYGALLMMAGWRMDEPVNRADFLKIITKQRSLNYIPGDKFQYSNTNYALLGIIIERIAGRSVADFMKAEIFVPLVMKNTLLRDDPLTMVPRRATNYTPDGKGGYKINYVWGFTKVMGPSSIHTTHNDLAKWDSNFYTERLGGHGITNILYTSGILNSGESANYGYGLFTGLHKGLKMITHNGAGGGSFVLTRFPDQKISVSVLCNRYYTTTDASMLAEKVADIFLADKYQEPQTQQTFPIIPGGQTIDIEELKLYAGTYWMEGLGNKITLSVEDGKLMTRYNTDKKFPLTYIEKQKFFNKDESLVYTFGDVTANVLSLEITVPGTTELYKAERKPELNLSLTPLNQYAGKYNSEELEISWNIEFINGKLQLNQKNFESKILEPVYKDAFQFTHADETTNIPYLLKFMRDKNGTIEKINVSGGRLMDVVFNKSNVK